MDSSVRATAARPPTELDAALGGAQPPLEAVRQELSQRRAQAQEMGTLTPVDARATQALIERRFAEFAAANSGYYVLAPWNLEFVNRYMVPAVQVLRFCRSDSADPRHMAVALEAAKAAVRTFASDPLVRFVPAIMAANQPFVIPYSIASAGDPAHVAAKCGRAMTRLGRFNHLRDMEHQLRKLGAEEVAAAVDPRGGPAGSAGPPPPVPPPPSNDAWAWYHTQAKSFRLSGDGGPPGPDPVSGFPPACTVLREAHRRGRATLDQLEGMGLEGRLALRAAAAAASAAPAPPSRVVPDLDSGEVGQEETKAPQPDAGKGEEEEGVSGGPPLPRPPSPVTGPGKPVLEGTDLGGEDPSYFPASRHMAVAQFCAASYGPDWDLPEDSPDFPEAAGMEMVAILWGGVYGRQEDAQQAVDTTISVFARGLDTFVHNLYVPVCPSEAMRERSIPESRKAAHPAMDKPLNDVFNAGAAHVARAAVAREANALGGAVIPETVVDGGAPPDLDAATATLEPPMRVTGRTWAVAPSAPPPPSSPAEPPPLL